MVCAAVATVGFNPRARVGRDHARSRLHHSQHIVSIHAPAWGATPLTRHIADRRRVSIHAPAWGATAAHLCAVRTPAVSIHAPAWGATYQYRVAWRPHQFQSTRPRGARLESVPQLEMRVRVSIHAPAWGATRSRRSNTHRVMFQSTRPRGARLFQPG